MHRLFAILLLLSFTLPGLWAQSDDVKNLERKIESQSNELKKLRQDIEKLNSQIKKKSASERSTVKTIQDLDRQIDMIRKLQRGLRKERQLKQEQVDLLQASIDANGAKIAVMKKRYARRAVKAYKLGHQREVEYLLAADDINQAIRRSLYFSAVHDAEARLLNELESLIHLNRQDRTQLESRMAELDRNLAEEARNARQLANKQDQKERQLKKIKQDQTALRQQVTAKQAAAKAVEKLITDLEAEHQARLRELANRKGVSLEQASRAFAQNKGKLGWPVDGQVVSRFGTQKNQRLGTITDNPGIEIAAPRGRPVHAVMEGIVVAITWIPSYGNTLILDHGGGYYTVYAHLEDIQVSTDSYVLRNQMVAKVGETGSLEGPRLHFEVWRGETKENPLLWLRK